MQPLTTQPEPLEPNWPAPSRAAPPGGIVAALGDWRHTDGPLYLKLANALRGAIERGELTPGIRLPSERRLSQLLHVGRATVADALEQLRSDGWVETVHGRGTSVPLGVRERLANVPFERSIVPRRERSPSNTPPPTAGSVDLSSATPAGLDDLVSAAVATAAEDLHQLVGSVDYSPFGLPPLRSAIADHLTATGLPTRPHEVLVTSGAQQAIGLVADLLLAPGDTVVVEAPTYPGAIDAFTRAGARVIFVAADTLADDPTTFVEALRRLCPRLVYLMPSCHAITGRVLAAEARATVARAAHRIGVMVLEDNIFADFTRADPPPPIAAFASPDAGLFTIGSLSKLIWNGLRIGWIRAPGSFIADILHSKALADLGTSALAQSVASQLLREHLPTAAAFRRAELAAAVETTETLLTDALPSWSWTSPDGGRSLWIRLPAGDATSFLRAARRHGVYCAPGRGFSRQAADAVRLRFMYVQPDATLQEGIHRLSRAWREYSAQGLTVNTR